MTKIGFTETFEILTERMKSEGYSHVVTSLSKIADCQERTCQNCRSFGMEYIGFRRRYLVRNFAFCLNCKTLEDY